MTEAEWLTGDAPLKMLEFLKGKVSDRKFWLFTALCVRKLPPALDAKQALAELWEGYADGQLTETQVKLFFRSDLNLSMDPPLSPPWRAARSGVYEIMFWFTERGATEYPYLCKLIRDLFQNPFRNIMVGSARLAPNVVTLAQAIYDDRAFDRLPLLADALEEAGCDNQEILDHCRSNNEHVRGCWVVDLILGKS